MKPDDRIRVLAPVSGQVAAFAVVLALGLLFGHRASPSRSVLAPPPNMLTVTAFKSDQSMAGYQVAVFDAAGVRIVGRGQTDRFGYFSLPVRPGTYQVCLQIPGGYSIGSSTVRTSEEAIAPYRPPARTGLSPRSWECGRAKADTGISFEFTKGPVP